MSEVRPARELRYAESAGEGFVNTTAFEWLSRAGFVARAAIYAIIGVLALKLAIGEGGKLTDQQGALKTVAGQPFGSILLTLLAIGLGGYSLWRLFRAALGRGPEGSDSGFQRLAALASGLAYGALCVLAVEILIGSGSSSSSDPKSSAAGILGWPGGPWIVAAIGVVTVGVALYQGYRGHHAEIPRGVENRGDEPRCPQVDRTLGNRWASRTDGRVRPHRRLPHQGGGGI